MKNFILSSTGILFSDRFFRVENRKSHRHQWRSRSWTRQKWEFCNFFGGNGKLQPSNSTPICLEFWRELLWKKRWDCVFIFSKDKDSQNQRILKNVEIAIIEIIWICRNVCKPRPARSAISHSLATSPLFPSTIQSNPCPSK